MKRTNHLGLMLVILGIAVVGLLFALGARKVLHSETEGLIGEGEIYMASSPGLYPDFTVEEVARMSSLSVKGRVGAGRFLKKDASGEERVKGTSSAPVRMWYFAQFHVTEYLKGSGPEEITVALPAAPDGNSLAVREESRLVQDDTYILNLFNKEGYDEWYLGPSVYRLYEGGYGKWKVVGESVVSDDGRDVTMSLSELRGRVDAACSSQVRPEFATAVLANQHCP